MLPKTSKSIIDFMTSQEFRIIQLESDVDIETISTTAPLDATVKTETVMGQYSPILKAVEGEVGDKIKSTSLIASLKLSLIILRILSARI